MDNYKIRVGITQGDINGVGYEVILKAFDNPAMLEICTPIIYGSPKVAAYHRKTLDLPANFTIVNSASEAADDKLSIVSCTSDDVKVEFAKVDVDAGRAASDALQKAVEEFNDGLIDVLVTAPVNHQVLYDDAFPFRNQHTYLEQSVGAGTLSLPIYVKNGFRLASVTDNMPLREVPGMLTKELVCERMQAFCDSLKHDFGVDAPRIAVLSLNPGVNDGASFGNEEEQVIVPALREMAQTGILCFGPYGVDDFMSKGNYLHFDGILAMYQDQGLAVFHTLAQDEGVVFTSGLPIVRTAPTYHMNYDVVGKGVMDESSFRDAIYLAIDIFRQRERDAEAQANPLRKQYYDRHDDSDKLKQLDNTNEEDL